MTSDRVQTTIALFAGIQLPVPDGGEKGETSDFARVFAGMMGSATPGDGMADSSGKSGMASGTLGFASRAGETEILSGSGRVTSDNGVPAGMETIALSADSGVCKGYCSTRTGKSEGCDDRRNPGACGYFDR